MRNKRNHIALHLFRHALHDDCNVGVLRLRLCMFFGLCLHVLTDMRVLTDILSFVLLG